MNSAGMSIFFASSLAMWIDCGEKSTPVTFAPSNASDSVSVPIWHCRCSSCFPAIG